MSLSIIGIGEVLWDLLPTGPQLGGAPANFASHAQALGARAQVVTRIGNDALGRDVLERFGRVNLPVETVQLDGARPTGTVTVALTGQGLPQFVIREDVAWDRIEVTPEALAAVRGADAVCFGSLAQRSSVSRASIQRLLAAAPDPALVIFDANLRQKFYSKELIEQSLRFANVLKLNDDELSVFTEMFSLSGGIRPRIEQLSEMFELKVAVLTCGSNGSFVFDRKSWSEQLPKPVEVVDTVGAGDAFTAALALGLLKNMALGEVHAFAAEVARYVCSQAGATPELPPALRNRFRSESGTGSNTSAAEVPSLPSAVPVRH